MDFVKKLIGEAHRRSIWQVLSVYMVGSWVALQVVEVISESAGLPDWAQPFALILLILGLPVVVATAIVQEGVRGEDVRGRDNAAAPGEETRSAGVGPENPDATSAGEASEHGSDLDRPVAVSSKASKRKRVFTWKNAIAGGVAAFAFLGIAVAGYFVLWSAGIGPVGSLVAQGVFDEGDRVVLADFHNATPDSLLGSVVTDALRIDLSSSEALTLVEPNAVRDVLVRMQRDPDQELSAELAREVAVRDGMKAVLEGDVGAAGSGYILSATLRASESGETMASFRRTAENVEEVIGAIDKLSQDIREKAGESLLSIKRGAPLEQVTTTSLEALRKFTEAEKLFDAGDEAGSIALLEEAVALDSAFAMAHRKMAITLYNMGIEREREVEALEAAFRHRDRLTERERLITEASYHNGITGDRDAIMRAYQGVLRIAPDDPAALNNLANVYNEMEDFDRAAELYEKAVNGPGTSNTAHSNLVRTRLLQGDMDGARVDHAAFQAAYPTDPNIQDRGFWIHVLSKDWEAAEATVAEWEANAELPFVYQVNVHWYRAQMATAQGKMGEARVEAGQAQRLAEAEFGLAFGWQYSVYSAWLEFMVGNVEEARSILLALEDRKLFDQIPLSVRNYGLAVGLHSLVGNVDEALAYLRRWEEEVPPELAGRYDEDERKVRRNMVGGIGADPEGVLAAIEEYRARLRCGRCYRLEEAEALEAMGRSKEARDVWMSTATQIEANFSISLLQRPLAWERVGSLSDEMGDTEAALRGYREFTDLWADADPELQPRVQAAQERIRELEAAGAGG